ncbi:MAG: ribosome silencing factor [Bacteroidales bacterium]|nr:ribosome silencing factor [Bacteroidales bacterium]
MTQENNNEKILVDAIVEGLQDNKAKSITVLDMKGVEGAITDYFVIASCDSTTQADGAADSVWDKVHELTGRKPLHDEGRQNAQWILLDYGEAIVHVFLRDVREYYDLEGLWSDAVRQDIDDLD